MLLNIRRVLIAAIVMLASALTLTVLVASPNDTVQRVDDWFLARMLDVRSDPLTDLLEAVSLLGSAVVSWSLRTFVVVALLSRRRYLQLGAFAGAVVTSELCIGPLKALIDRPRPPGSLVATGGAAYPSGHAIAIAVTAVGLVVALLPPGRRRLRWELVATGLTFLVALSRAYLAAHWLSDVVGGSLIGGGLALGWPAALATARARASSERTQDGDSGVSAATAPSEPSGISGTRRDV